MNRNLVATVTLLFVSSLALAQELPNDATQDPDAAFRLFNTKSANFFLRLDTRNGRIWQLYWRDRDSNEIEPVNAEALVADGRPGRFTLYPTTNNFTFILLDQETGAAWQVRWGETLDRFIVQID